MILLGIIEVGLMMWTRSTLQMVAAQIARYPAIVSSLCAHGAAQYAVSLAEQWLPTHAFTTSDVVVSATSTYYGASEIFEAVTISAPVWTGGLVYPISGGPISGGSQTLQACFPR